MGCANSKEEPKVAKAPTNVPVQITQPGKIERSSELDIVSPAVISSASVNPPAEESVNSIEDLFNKLTKTGQYQNCIDYEAFLSISLVKDMIDDKILLESNIRGLFEIVDADGDNHINMKEFLELVGYVCLAETESKRLSSEKKSETVSTIISSPTKPQQSTSASDHSTCLGHPIISNINSEISLVGATAPTLSPATTTQPLHAPLSIETTAAIEDKPQQPSNTTATQPLSPLSPNSPLTPASTTSEVVFSPNGTATKRAPKKRLVHIPLPEESGGDNIKVVPIFDKVMSADNITHHNENSINSTNNTNNSGNNSGNSNSGSNVNVVGRGGVGALLMAHHNSKNNLNSTSNNNIHVALPIRSVSAKNNSNIDHEQADRDDKAYKLFLKSQSLSSINAPKNEPKSDPNFDANVDEPVKSRPKPAQKKGFLKGDETIITPDNGSNSNNSSTVTSPNSNPNKSAKNYYVLDGGELKYMDHDSKSYQTISLHNAKVEVRNDVLEIITEEDLEDDNTPTGSNTTAHLDGSADGTNGLDTASAESTAAMDASSPGAFSKNSPKLNTSSSLSPNSSSYNLGSSGGGNRRSTRIVSLKVRNAQDANDWKAALAEHIDYNKST